MEIQKIFTDTEGNEKLYSVLLSEEELTLFSEIQKEFAFKDYKGLTKEQAKALREFRNQEAIRLNNFRNSRKIPLLKDESFHRLKSNQKFLSFDTKDAYGKTHNAKISEYGFEGAKKVSVDKAVRASIDEANKRSSMVRKNMVRTNRIKKAAKIGAITAALAGLGYGAKKIYDKNKKEQ